MRITEELADPWGWLVAGVSGGVGWVVLAGSAPIGIPVVAGALIGIGAQMVGIAHGAFEAALKYTQEREQFGQAISNFQAIQFQLAEMAVEIEAARLLVYRAAWLSRNGEYKNAEGSQSKLYAGRTAVWVTERAIQILGGYGYTREYPVERWHRDAKIMDIFEGTEQIQELVISRAISGLRIE